MMRTPIYRNGYVKMFLSFVIMGMALTVRQPMMMIQFLAGALYFCMGLRLVLMSHERMAGAAIHRLIVRKK